MPNGNYQYSPVTIYVRSNNNVVVVVYGNNSVLNGIINYYDGEKWSGWKTIATTDNLANYLPLTGGTMSGTIYGSRGGEFSDDGNSYINTGGYKNWLTNILNDFSTKIDSRVKTNNSTEFMDLTAFDALYGANSTPATYGFIVIHGYSRPNLWIGDTYYFLVSYGNKLYTGMQVNGATTITWNENISSSNFSLSGTTLTITT